MYVRVMPEKKQTPKWVLWMYVVLPLFALNYTLFNDGWRRWFGASMLLLCVVWWAKFFLERKNDSST